MRYLIIVLSFFLITCGGGGGGSPTEPVGPTEPTAPTVEDILLTTNEDVPSVIDLKGTDPANLPLTFTISSQPNNGSFVLSGNAGTYTPNANYNGSDELQYIASNGSKSSNIGTVTITVNAVNDDPESIDVSVSTNEDHSIDITLQANEYDGDEIVFQIDEQVSNGTLSLSGNVASYTPNTNWYGVDNFVFSVYDNTGKSVLKSGNGTIVVNPINDLPTVEDIYDVVINFSEVEAINLIGSDVDGDALSFEIGTNPSKGNVSVSNDTVYFSPTSGYGADTFTYKAYDGTQYSSDGNIFVDISSSQYYVQHTISPLISMQNARLNAFILSDGSAIVGTSGYTYDGVHNYWPVLLKINENEMTELRSNFSTNNELVDDYQRLLNLTQRSDGGFLMTIRHLSSNHHEGIFLDNNFNVQSSVLFDYGGWYTTLGNFSNHYYELVELSNGNYLYKNRLLDSSLNEIEYFNVDRVAEIDNRLYLTSSDEIVEYDINNGSVINQTTIETNADSYNMLLKREGGFFLLNHQLEGHHPGGNLLVLDNDFNILSFKLVDNSSGGWAPFIASSSDGGFFICRKQIGSYEIVFDKYNKDGNLEFSSEINHPAGSRFYGAIAVVEYDDYYKIFGEDGSRGISSMAITKLGNRIF